MGHVCNVFIHEDERDTTERANARLIAAAPELLGLMQEVEEYLAATSANVHDPLWERVKAAIAKATGGDE